MVNIIPRQMRIIALLFGFTGSDVPVCGLSLFNGTQRHRFSKASRSPVKARTGGTVTLRSTASHYKLLSEEAGTYVYDHDTTSMRFHRPGVSQRSSRIIL